MPYTIVFDSNDAIYRPAIRVFDILWFIIAIFVYSSMIIINYVQTSNISFTSSKVLDCSSQLILFLSIVFGLLVILIDILNRFKFVDILNKFIRIDEKVRPFVQFLDFAFRLSYFSILNFWTQLAKIGIHFNYKRLYQHNWQWCIAVLALIMLMLIATVYTWLHTVPLIVFFTCILQNAVLIWTSTIYNILLYSLYKRFSALNTFLRWVLVIIIDNKNWNAADNWLKKIDFFHYFN